MNTKLIIKILLPITIIGCIYLTIVTSNSPALYHQDFYQSFSHLKKTLSEKKTFDLIFVGPSSLASSIVPKEISPAAVNLSVFAISPVEDYFIIKKAFENNLKPKCVVFNFNYNRRSYFNKSDPLDTIWPLFSEGFLTFDDLKEFLTDFNSIYKTHTDYSTLQFYFRVMTNKFKLTRYHLMTFFAYLKHNSFSKKVFGTRSADALPEDNNENQGFILKENNGIDFFSNYNIHYLNDFETSPLTDRYFIKTFQYIISKGARPIFLFTPIAPNAHPAKRYNQQIREHLAGLLEDKLSLNESSLYYNGRSWRDLVYIDLNHIDEKSAHIYSKRISNDLLNACNLK